MLFLKTQIRKCSGRMKRSLSNPRSSGSWPAPVISKAIEHELAATDEELNKYLKGILAAQSRIYEVCKETPLQFAPTLSKILGNEVYLKREDLHEVFSFKVRGAFNKISALPEEQKSKGIITCSAGNHAQAVALSASRLGIKNVIVMPEGTPKIKVDSVRKFTDSVLLKGKNFDEAQAVALKLCAEENMTLIHPFDDFDVICGQGTIGIEILKQIPTNSLSKLHGVFCCAGGGGLLAGVGSYLKNISASEFRSSEAEFQLFGVEAKDADGMTRSLMNQQRVLLEEVGLFADGAAIKIPGEKCFSVCLRVVDKMITVSTDEICQAIKLIYNDIRAIVEPAGALSVAGLIKYAKLTGIEGKALVAVLSGANMDFDRLRFVTERADTSEKIIHIEFSQINSNLLKVCEIIMPRDITEINYRKKSSSTADALISFQATADGEEVDFNFIENHLNCEITDLSLNEVAKTHVRYLSGTRHTSSAPAERLFRFEFQGSPGALHLFLKKIDEILLNRENTRVQATLFHYRNHGDDVGRVLIGFESSEETSLVFTECLFSLGIDFTEETENPVYSKFLQK